MNAIRRLDKTNWKLESYCNSYGTLYCVVRNLYSNNLSNSSLTFIRFKGHVIKRCTVYEYVEGHPRGFVLVYLRDLCVQLENIAFLIFHYIITIDNVRIK